jgi:hypothetical protein
VIKFLNSRRRLAAVVGVCLVLVVGLVGFLESRPVVEAALITPYDFYDDFSGDLSQWSSVRGTWSIVNEEMVQSDPDIWEAFSVAGSSEYADYVIETKVKLVSGVETSAGILLRFGDVNNY